MTKKTFLYDNHVKLGAKIVDFAGWYMPVQYKTSIMEEHNNVRNAVGLFDVSHMGEIIIEGLDAENFLNSIVPQDISKLIDGKAVYCQLTNENGGIVDDLIIYRLEENKYLIVANASRIDEDINWMVRNIKDYNVALRDESYNYSMIAVQGPKAVVYIESLCKETMPSFFSIRKGRLFDIDLWISRTGYTGEDGVELIVKNRYISKLWEKLLENGINFGVKPIGLGARDTLRLEAALPLYGHELDEETTPIEAGLGWSVPIDKTDFYNGKERIISQKKNGTEKFRYGVKMLSKAIARNGYEVYFNNEKIGVVTSGSISPSRGDNIALVLIKKMENIAIGSKIQISIREKLYDAEIIKLPFVQKRNKNV